MGIVRKDKAQFRCPLPRARYSETGRDRPAHQCLECSLGRPFASLDQDVDPNLMGLRGIQRCGRTDGIGGLRSVSLL